MIALAVAVVLAIFLLYTSIAGGGVPSISPSELQGRTGDVQLVGKVVGPISGNALDEPLRFKLRDRDGDATTLVAVSYTGSVSDQFRVGREVVVDGAVRDGVFVAKKDSLITKCPSKYTALDPKTESR